MMQELKKQSYGSALTELLNQELVNIIPVSKFNDYYDFPTVGAIRQYIFSNRNNFRDLVIVYSGNRQYVNVLALIEWLKNNKQDKK